MALNCSPENLRDEIRASTQFRDKFIKHQEELSNRYTGRWYREDKQPDGPVTSNHSFEFLSVMLPAIAFSNPRCKITALNPDIADVTGTITMRDRAMGIQAALNRWSEDDEIGTVITQAALDFFFSWCVFLVSVQDQPGWQNVEMVPQKPFLMKIENERYLMDLEAKNPDPMTYNGPRYCGHMWQADVEDLLDDPNYDSNAVEQLAGSTDLERHEYDKSTSSIEVPKRNQILAWDIWVPEKTLSDDPAMNGVIYTVGAGYSSEGVTKTTEYLSDPRPAYCPPWGPYILCGAYSVKGSPYPLSPLVATAEQAEIHNSHTTKASEDAADYKRFVYGKSGANTADSDRVKKVGHGQMVLLDNPETLGQMEIGGVTDAQYKFIEQSKESLDRSSGLSDQGRGLPSQVSPPTATEAAIAMGGGEARKAGVQSTFRKGVSRVFKSAAWYAFYGDDFQMALGEEGREMGIMEYQGGIEPGMESFRFYDLSMAIDPLSMEHTSQALLQQRVDKAFGTMTQAAQIMPTTPWIRWREPMRALFEALNLGDADDWLDWQMLEQEQARLQQQQQEEQMQNALAQQASLAQPANAARTPAKPKSGAQQGQTKSLLGHVTQARQSGQQVVNAA